MVKIIAYVRVSTKEQSLEAQEEAIKNYAERKDISIVAWYSDFAMSGAIERKNFEKALSHAMEDEGLIVYDLSRAGRSAVNLLGNIQRLTDNGKLFISVADDMTNQNRTGKLLIAILSHIAEFERNLIRERIAAGREAAKKKGKRLGGPKPKHIPWEWVDTELKYGTPKTVIAKKLGVSQSTLQRRLRQRKEG